MYHERRTSRARSSLSAPESTRTSVENTHSPEQAPVGNVDEFIHTVDVAGNEPLNLGRDAVKLAVPRVAPPSTKTYLCCALASCTYLVLHVLLLSFSRTRCTSAEEVCQSTDSADTNASRSRGAAFHFLLRLERHKSQAPMDWWKWLIVAATALGIIIGTMMCYFWLRRRRLRRWDSQTRPLRLEDSMIPEHSSSKSKHLPPTEGTVIYTDAGSNCKTSQLAVADFGDANFEIGDDSSSDLP
ncbi:MAG: hypothetical protein MHM6MM_004189 [Cercozoa sp. M6MM]